MTVNDAFRLAYGTGGVDHVCKVVREKTEGDYRWKKWNQSHQCLATGNCLEPAA